MSTSRALQTLRKSHSNVLRHSSHPKRRFTLAASLESSHGTDVSSARAKLLGQKLDYLRAALDQKELHPNKIWAHYVNAADAVGYTSLPLEIHQEVLRKCTPPAANVREAAMRRLSQGLRPLSPHIHEGRFQTIVRHIRALGQKPSIDDYNFVLEQFAATGHHTGSIMVFKEMQTLGVIPEPKTYGLVLQAIARRLALPCHFFARPRLITQTRKMLSDVLSSMQRTQTPIIGSNADLTLRILKETLDLKGFETLMKMVYGVDLSNPDRLVLEAEANPKTGVASLFAKSPPSTPSPFTTATLNTTLDMLGRIGDVSKLVQAFEVLTTPLSPQAGSYFSSQFEDEDDDGWSFIQPPVGPAAVPATSQLPCAKANTTSYTILLRHLSQMKHGVLLRHYLKQAMELDWSTRAALRKSVREKPLDQVEPPSFAITKNMLLSVHGLANRERILSLSRWLDSKIPKLIKMKKKDLTFYKQKLAELGEGAAECGGESNSSQTTTPATPRDHSTNTSTWSPMRHFPELDLSLTQGTAPPTVSTPKNFSLPLHISILERDITEISNFHSYLSQILGRNTQRMKEKLGRRVWRGQDVYMVSNGARKKMSKTQWAEVVNFRERKNVVITDRYHSKVMPGQPGPLIKPRWLDVKLGRSLGISRTVDRF